MVHKSSETLVCKMIGGTLFLATLNFLKASMLLHICVWDTKLQLFSAGISVYTHGEQKEDWHKQNVIYIQILITIK